MIGLAHHDEKRKIEVARGGSLAGPPAADARRDDVGTDGDGGVATPPTAPGDLDQLLLGAQLALDYAGVQIDLAGRSVLEDYIVAGVKTPDQVDADQVAAQLALRYPGEQLRLVAAALDAAEARLAAARPVTDDPAVRVGWTRACALVHALRVAVAAVVAAVTVGAAGGGPAPPSPSGTTPSPRAEAASGLVAVGDPGPEGAAFILNGVQVAEAASCREVAPSDPGGGRGIKLPAAFAAWLREQIALDRAIAAAAAPLVVETTQCTCEFAARVCPEHGTKAWRYYQGADHDRTCIREGCRKKAARKRGKRARKVLGRLGAVHWSVDEITVPPVMQPRLAASASYRRQVRDAARNTLWGWLTKWAFRGERVLLGSAAFEHPCGNDERVFRWHLHFITPLIGVRTRDEGVVQGRYKVPVHALDDFRAMWRARLRKQFGVDVAEVDVHHGFARAGATFEDVVEQHDQGDIDACVAKRTHASNYVCRTFPSWTHDVQRPHYLGLLSHAGRKRWESAQAKREASGKGRVPPAPEPEPLADVDYCEECGVELERGPLYHAYGADVYAGPLCRLSNWTERGPDTRRFLRDVLRGRRAPPVNPTGPAVVLTPYAPPVGTTRGTPAYGWLVRP